MKFKFLWEHSHACLHPVCVCFHSVQGEVSTTVVTETERLAESNMAGPSQKRLADTCSCVLAHYLVPRPLKVIVVQLKQVLPQLWIFSSVVGNWNNHLTITEGLNDCTHGHYSHLVDLLIYLLVLSHWIVSSFKAERVYLTL